MNVVLYPLRYLELRTEAGRPLYTRNAILVVAIAVLVSAPFLLTSAIFFGSGGFLDKFGAFSGVLTGFYIAALVGIATFTTTLGDLDDVIENGQVTRKSSDGDEEPLTRRQYVSSLFGYLAFLALLISFLAILFVVIAGVSVTVPGLPEADRIMGRPAAQAVRSLVRGMAIVGVNIVLAHMFVTTCHGLYYLIDRLYEKKPMILPKASDPAPAKKAPRSRSAVSRAREP